MWCIRSYKNMETNKFIGFKIVNEKTLEVREFNVDEIKAILKFNENGIENLELDAYGAVRMKNMNPNQKVKAFKNSFTSKAKVSHYCIIMGYSNGLISYLMDDMNSNTVTVKTNTTLNALMMHLGVKNIKELRLYNAKIVYDVEAIRLYMYNINKAEYIHIGKVVDNSINSLFGEDWQVDLSETTGAGINITSMKYLNNHFNNVILPDGIERIERFNGGIDKLELPSSLKTLGIGCFEGTDIKKIKLSNNLITVPDKCFKQSDLNTVIFKGSEKLIGAEAFYECKKLQGALVTNAKYIGKRAFYKTGIEILNLDRVEEIDSEAFSLCSRLKTVKLGQNLKLIKSNAFRGCKSLIEVDIPVNVEVIYRSAFEGCKNLKRVRLSKKTRVHNDAFPKHVQIELV